MAHERTDVGSSTGLFGQPVRRLLLVDDDVPLLAAYRRLLGSVSEVVTAEESETALDLVRSQKFDAVVTDLCMPGRDGLDFLKELRQEDPNLPVIVMTGNPAVDSAARALEHGAFRYLVKPVDSIELKQAIQHAWRLHDMARLTRHALDSLGGAGAVDAAAAHSAELFESALAQLYMAYQPIVRLSDSSVYSHEALVRSREVSLPSPAALFAVAERLGRTHELNRAIRERVATDIRTHAITGLVFVNLNAEDLIDDTLYTKSCPLASVANQVVLEVTERQSLDHVDNVRARIFALRRLGFRIAIDDLGSGYSALTSFAQLEPDVVKIDMALVRDVHLEPTKRRLIRLISNLCLNMGISAVAEGVETPEELAALQDLGCDLFQGYVFARPAFPPPSVVWPAPQPGIDPRAFT